MTDPLYWLPDELEPVAFRLARADECAYEIGDLISAWSSNDPVRMHEEACDGMLLAKVDSIRPIPPRIAMLFSEAINHIRASIDNVVWYLVEKEVGAIGLEAELLVVFPITRDSKRFSSWCARRVKNGLHVFAEESGLGRRLRTLQSWSNATSTVPSSSARLSAIIGQPAEHADALTLLQKYSNADKHRTIRLATSRSFASHYDAPIWEQDQSPQVLEAGTIVHQTVEGTMSVIELNTTAVIMRPELFARFANPAAEINWLRRYVSGNVIPTLLVGLALDRGLPPRVDLSDSGEMHRERLLKGGQDDAMERLRPLAMGKYQAATEAGISLLKKRTED